MTPTPDFFLLRTKSKEIKRNLKLKFKNIFNTKTNQHNLFNMNRTELREDNWVTVKQK